MKSTKLSWWKLLKSILKADAMPETKFFKAWKEEDVVKDEAGNPKLIGCLFATDTRRALMVKNHGIDVHEGVYTIFGDDTVLCADVETTQKFRNKDHNRIFSQVLPLNTLENEDVPQLQSVGKTLVPISIPNDSTEDWTIGYRKGHVSIDADYLPPIKEWAEIAIHDESHPVRFHTIADDQAVIDYIVVPLSHGM